MVHFKYNGPLTHDVNVPEEVAHRSGGDAILITPGSSHEVTDEEWFWLKKTLDHAILAKVQVFGKEPKPAQEQPKG